MAKSFRTAKIGDRIYRAAIGVDFSGSEVKWTVDKYRLTQIGKRMTRNNRENRSKISEDCGLIRFACREDITQLEFSMWISKKDMDKDFFIIHDLSRGKVVYCLGKKAQENAKRELLTNLIKEINDEADKHRRKLRELDSEIARYNKYLEMK